MLLLHRRKYIFPHFLFYFFHLQSWKMYMTESLGVSSAIYVYKCMKCTSTCTCTTTKKLIIHRIQQGSHAIVRENTLNKCQSKHSYASAWRKASSSSSSTEQRIHNAMHIRCKSTIQTDSLACIHLNKQTEI